MDRMILQPKGLNVYFLVDCSGEIGSRTENIISAINSIVPELQRQNKRYPKMNMSVRVLRISSGASFTNITPTHINNFHAGPLFAGGGFDLGKGLTVIYDQLKNASKDTLPPIMALISNGHPTDDYKKALSQLQALPIYKASIRLSFAVDANADRAVLQEFACPSTEPRTLGELDTLPKVLES